MKKYLLLFMICASFGFKTSAHTVLDGIYVKEHNPTRQVIQFAYLREADVMWSKKSLGSC
ncbi:MAG: hypothetical protein IPJ79_06095 [Bacteroidetes bacterium]|nr:hypothetical protein [Bacteroidota bacterium]